LIRVARQEGVGVDSCVLGVPVRSLLSPPMSPQGHSACRHAARTLSYVQFLDIPAY
jgi:hypothetical protein